jgi:hypothetical protein
MGGLRPASLGESSGKAYNAQALGKPAGVAFPHDSRKDAAPRSAAPMQRRQKRLLAVHPAKFSLRSSWFVSFASV